ncbi:MAG: hypothetical protein JST35_10960 [Armatimonadetes bacterium]|nr:hypothetical protein [Armatimonadota bacterium]
MLKCEGMIFFLRGHPTPANLREIQAEKPGFIQVLIDDPSFIAWCSDADIETLRRLELDESIDYAFGWIEPSVGVDWGQALLKHCSQLLSLERSVEAVELPWEGAFLMHVLHDTGGYFAPRSTDFVHYISEPAEVTESDASGEGRQAEDFLLKSRW